MTTTSLPTLKNPRTIARRTEFSTAIFSLMRKRVKYTCDTSGYSVSYPIEEVVNKLYCNGCGKMHQLTRSELSDQDKATIKTLTQAARDNQEYLDVLDAQMMARVKKQVHSDEFDQGIYDEYRLPGTVKSSLLG